MAFPDYQSTMLPLLRLASDGKEHVRRDAISALADEFKLSQEERTELLPSGRQAIFHNRVGWAVTYLSKAKVLIRTGRGKFQITDRGTDLLKKHPDRIDVEVLSQFSEFVEFRNSSLKSESDNSLNQTTTESVEDPLDPEETLEASYHKLRYALVQEILERILSCSPAFFETLVIDLLVAMGYGGSRKDAGKAIGRTGDDGIDGIIKEDKLGMDIIYVQAKRWQSSVGRPVVQAFAGSLEGYRARKGVLITTSQFSSDAKEYINRIGKRIVLIDGEHLANLMLDHGVGVTEVNRYSIKKIDFDYFDEV